MAAPSLDELIARAEATAADDPDPGTAAEARQLIAARDPGVLSERYGNTIEFGTAGLRGLLGAGESRMNRRVVARTTAGLCAYVARTVHDAQRRGLCLGFDGRHLSRELAQTVAEIARGAGFVVHMFERVVPTPLLAFSVLELEAAVGVMITASHNPKQYNGYKVYWENGVQLLAPHDAGIAAAIAACPPTLQLPRLPPSAAAPAERTDAIEARYVSKVKALVGDAADASTLRIAYTALHGVGESLLRATLQATGFSDLHSVAAQAVPDPEFPTVAFPNPEEPGAMDAVLALATAIDADVALANDPDADRLAIATRDEQGVYRRWHGNEVGVLLADALLARAPHDGKNVVVCSIVSTPMLAAVARAHGARSEQTLTGFKWIASRALELEAGGERCVLGFEEALGYCLGDFVRDKDGIAAGTLVASIALEHKRQGRTLSEVLSALYRRHGFWHGDQLSISVPGGAGLSKMQAALQTLRAQPPTQLAELAVIAISDLSLGERRVGTQVHATDLPQSNVLIYELEGGHRLAVRPSGTEPKLKIYVDTTSTLAPDEPVAAARGRASELATELGRALRTRLAID